MKNKGLNFSLTYCLWWLAGVNRNLLENSPAEHLKYAAIGLTILLNGILAGFSSGFALYSVFHSWIVAIPALFWAILILNLDRYIVMTMGQEGVKKWVISVLRIAMTLVLSTVITVPLMLKFFEREIAAQLASDNQHKFTQAQGSLDSSYNEIKDLQEENRMLLEEIKVKEAEFNKAYEDFTQEANGTGGTGVFGKGIVYEEKKEHYEQVKTDLDALRTRNNASIDANKTRISVLLASKQDKLAVLTKVNDNANGFLGQYIALDKLRQSNQSANNFYYLLVLSFCLLETLPITSKIFSSEGVYEHAVKTEEALKKHFINEKFSRDKDIEEKQLSSKYKTMNDVIDLKAALAQRIVDGSFKTAKNKFNGFQSDIMRQDLVDRIQTTIEKEFNDTLPFV